MVAGTIVAYLSGEWIGRGYALINERLAQQIHESFCRATEHYATDSTQQLSLLFRRELDKCRLERLRFRLDTVELTDREALRQAVKKGEVVLATDHAPHTLEEKQQAYFDCPSGSPWVEHSLPMMLELLHQGVFALTEIVEAMCHRPARLFGMEKRGFLRPGYAADLALVEPETAWTVEKSNIDYKCGWSALEGRTLHGKVRSTFVNGNLVYDQGRVLMPGYRGERLLFER